MSYWTYVCPECGADNPPIGHPHKVGLIPLELIPREIAGALAACLTDEQTIETRDSVIESDRGVFYLNIPKHVAEAALAQYQEAIQ